MKLRHSEQSSRNFCPHGADTLGSGGQQRAREPYPHRARHPSAKFVPESVSSPLPSGYVTVMPVDTLSPAAPAAPALPFRLRTKVPSYLLPRPADGGARKPSAVERLEADKAKYVKSLHVANTRQEPVQPPLARQPLFSPGPRGPVLTPSRRALPCPGRRPQLDVGILNSLINLCDSPVSPAEASRTPRRPEGSAHKVPPATPPRPPPSTVAVRRVDVRPLPASPARPCPSPGTPATSSPGRPPGLQRSKSDLSERFSRAAADLERFFNFCGLDPEEARGLGVAHLARASSDIVSLAGPSAGPCSSEGGCSRRSSATVEERALERVPYGVSVIERNARVIKWLYGLRQARDPPATEG
ncbi:protein FAM110A isoform X2 [Mesocricetus auratus]|uniref:Protein FAM110A isoform X2 n=1 Tax=Mesocricetus auratus TaxID=10036 RepID=A0A3Q0CUF7_MESAU|nr:protein FAM110A isoform X2 [Mesocricetus auratus]